MNVDLIKKSLKTRWAGKKILYKESVESTNLWATRSQEKEPRGTVFLADFQTAGRGRMKRTWESPSGKNILLSLIDTPPKDETRTSQLTLVAGLAVCAALSSLHPKVSCGLKWPNDLVVKEKKLSGILSEYDPKPGKVVMGLGLNVNVVANDFSAEVGKTATSLAIETGRDTPREPLIAACLNEYEKWRETFDRSGTEAIIAAWNEASVHVGKKIRVVEDGSAIEGICEGLDPNGFLVVNESGRRKTIVTGDVILL